MILKNSSKHPQYKRWRSIVAKCRNPGNRDFVNKNGGTIDLDYAWKPENPEALFNFDLWIERELNKNPVLRTDEYFVVRIDNNKDYSPANCKIVDRKVFTQTHKNKTLTLEKVIAMRDYAREHPTATLLDIAAKFEYDCLANISRAIRGTIWKNANETSMPIGKKLNQYQFDDNRLIQ